MSRLMRLANQSQAALEEASKQTGARPDELRDAARFLIQQLCFARGADHYRVLGLEFDASPEQIKDHYHQLIWLFHPDRTAARESWTDHFAGRVNDAWAVLSRAESRANYDAQLEQAKALNPVQDAETVPTDPPCWPPDILPQPPQDSSYSRPRAASTRRWWPAVLMSGIAVGGGMLLIWANYPEMNAQSPPTYRPTTSVDPVPAVQDQKPVPKPVDRNAIDLFLTPPDWRAISQRELLTRQQSANDRAVRPESRQSDLPVTGAVEAKLKQPSVEQLRLDQLLQSEQAERIRIDKEIKAEQAWRERMAAERLKQERLQAQLDQLERLRVEEEIKADQRRQELAIENERRRLAQTREKVGRLPEQPRPTPDEIPGADPVRPSSASDKSKPSSHPIPATAATRIKGASSDDAKLTAREAQKVVDRYVAAYQRGDLHTLMSLYTTDVLVNGQNYGAIRRNFESFFEDQIIQRLDLNDLQWDHRSDVSSLKARYKLSLQRRGDGQNHESKGNIQFELRKQEGKFAIQTLDYDWVEN
jgi:curved DNA-binding protein CbpA